jgi:hypothetical protein
MDEFVPPYPDRPARPLPALATLRRARRNFLAIWEDRCFEWEVFSTRLLLRTLFVCNSPDTVVSAFVEHHDSFERKTHGADDGALLRRSSMCRICRCLRRSWSKLL